MKVIITAGPKLAATEKDDPSKHEQFVGEGADYLTAKQEAEAKVPEGLIKLNIRTAD